MLKRTKEEIAGIARVQKKKSRTLLTYQLRTNPSKLLPCLDIRILEDKS